MHPVPDAGRVPARQPHVGHPVAAGPALDLEDDPDGRPVVVAARGGQQGPDRGHQLGRCRRRCARSRTARGGRAARDLRGAQRGTSGRGGRSARRPREAVVSTRWASTRRRRAPAEPPPGPRPRLGRAGTAAAVSRSRIIASTRSGSAPPRSILLTNSRVGTPQPLQGPHAAPPSGPARPRRRTPRARRRRAPRATRSTSAMKSGWPGVSMRLTARSSSVKATTAARMVMPRRRSSSSESVWVVPSSTLPSASVTPAA